MSLGAAILANYVAKEGTNCPLKGAVGISCHFESSKSFEFMRSNLFGVYDYVLGTALLASMMPSL